jgi:hypothetical protein
MGEYHFSGQYQQNPAPREGGIIRPLAWLNIWGIFVVICGTRILMYYSVHLKFSVPQSEWLQGNQHS